jgi:glycosyltransferase involved in cell wall biosynthesis
MKLAIIATYTVDHIMGGREVHIKMLSECLVNKGHEVSILTTRHPEGLRYKNDNGVNIYYFNKNQPKIHRVGYYKDFCKYFETINQGRKFDIIHNQHTLIGYSYIKFCKKTLPIVTTFHGTMKNEIRSSLNTKSIKGLALAAYFYVRYLYCPTEKVTVYKSEKVIAVSSELGEDIKKQYDISEKLVVIPNGVDTTKFKPMSSDVLKRNLNIIDEKLIVSVGRIDEQKGFQLLIQALPGILEKFDVKLVIVGTGPYLPSLKSIAEKRGQQDKVIFAGRVSDDDLPKYYNLADVFAFPTLRLEGLPYVIPEAMACGRPVISSRIGGIPTAIKNGRDGILIEPGNLDELTKNILYLLGNEDAANAMGKRAREKVINELSLDKMVEDTIKVYEDVING